MSELNPLVLWGMRLGFVMLALLIVVVQLLPINTSTRSWAGPDLVMAFAFAWSLRRPDYVPVVLLTLVLLMADLLLQRPPGLLALLTLVAIESLKAQGRTLRDGTFANEWVSVSTAIIGIMIINRVILAVTLVPVPRISLILFETGATVLVYPLIVFVTHALMGVRKVAPGDLDGLGQRV